MKVVIHPDLKEFLFCLKSGDVRFLVIGAYVLATLGRPRFSEDLDVFVDATPQNASVIAAALREFGGFEELARVVSDHQSQADRMTTIGRAPLAIDVTTGIDGVTFEEGGRGETKSRSTASSSASLASASTSEPSALPAAPRTSPI